MRIRAAHDVRSKTAVIDATASGDTPVVAGVSGRKIRLLSFFFVSSAAVSVKFRDDAGSPKDLTGPMPVAANGGVVSHVTCQGYVGETGRGQALNINLSAASNVGGQVCYVEV
jgi:hypothetical protein